MKDQQDAGGDSKELEGKAAERYISELLIRGIIPASQLIEVVISRLKFGLMETWHSAWNETSFVMFARSIVYIPECKDRKGRLSR
ncbi:Hypothetical predicted protein [Pelobates cultripes]|uniref:Uncharacterized protein n=1 Tax=Pelobates cultripes TaxID=61616 RepID=A0AAD1VUA1_PELCU|nr:Hypothetical predicted protein [Pelobates cultripes]